MDGGSDGAPGYRSGIGDEVERGGVKGFEAQADHEGASDGYRCAESGAAFDEGAEAEGDEKELEAAVGGDSGYGLLHDFKLAGLDGDVVEEDGGDDDPYDFQEAVGRAVQKAAYGHLGGHVEDQDGAENRGCGAGDGTEMGADFEAGEQAEKNNDGQSGNERGEPPMSQGIIDLIPSHRQSSRKYRFISIVCTACTAKVALGEAES